MEEFSSSDREYLIEKILELFEEMNEESDGENLPKQSETDK